jgi:hypothetical protein
MTLPIGSRLAAAPTPKPKPQPAPKAPVHVPAVAPGKLATITSHDAPPVVHKPAASKPVHHAGPSHAAPAHSPSPATAVVAPGKLAAITAHDAPPAGRQKTSGPSQAAAGARLTALSGKLRELSRPDSTPAGTSTPAPRKPATPTPPLGVSGRFGPIGVPSPTAPHGSGGGGGSIFGSLWHGVEHVASSAVHGAEHLATDVGHAAKKAADVTLENSFVRHHLGTIATAATVASVFVPALAPVAIGLNVANAASQAIGAAEHRAGSSYVSAGYSALNAATGGTLAGLRGVESAGAAAARTGVRLVQSAGFAAQSQRSYQQGGPEASARSGAQLGLAGIRLLEVIR